MPFNNTAKNGMLDALDESSAIVPITHVGIHTIGTDPALGTDAASGEASGGSPTYARQSVTFSAASSGQKVNSGALTFDVAAGTYGYFTLFNHATANSGNYRGFIPFGGSTALKGFATVRATSGAFDSVSHGLSNGDRVILYHVFSETFPTGTSLTQGAPLYVVNASANDFKVATTAGGTAIDITAIGGGEIYWSRIVPEVFAAQGQITVAAGALVLDATAI